MKKKILSAALAASFTLVCAGAAMAATDSAPTVYVNEGLIIFDDQAPVIVSDRTLIPARGVFEAMGAAVEWDGETRVVDVTSSDNKTLVRLAIDDSTMKVYDLSGMISTLLSGQDFNAPSTDVTLDVAPQIMNDRTMIPLRAIGEALDADVQWDGNSREIKITTADAPASKDDCPSLSLSASAETAAAGETFDLYVNLDNVDFTEGTYVSGVTATIGYDSSCFEFVGAALMNGDTVVEDALGAENADFAGLYVKTPYVTINSETAAKANGIVMKLTFKSLTGDLGIFSLSNGYHTKVGYNTTLLIDNSEGSVEYYGDTLRVDTTPVFINSGSSNVTDNAADADVADGDTSAGTDDAGAEDAADTAEADTNTDTNTDSAE